MGFFVFPFASIFFISPSSSLLSKITEENISNNWFHGEWSSFTIVLPNLFLWAAYWVFAHFKEVLGCFEWTFLHEYNISYNFTFTYSTLFYLYSLKCLIVNLILNTFHYSAKSWNKSKFVQWLQSYHLHILSLAFRIPECSDCHVVYAGIKVWAMRTNQSDTTRKKHA